MIDEVKDIMKNPQSIIETTVGEMPEALRKEICDRVSRHSISILAVDHVDGKDVSRLCGSGTLVRVGNVEAVVTAQHVLAKSAWADAEYVGFAYLDYEHGRPHLKSMFTEVHIAEPQSNAEGPDLAAIIIPSELGGWLREKKWFVNLEKVRDMYSGDPLPLGFGVWAIAGSPDFMSLREDSERGATDILSLTSYVMLSGPNRGFDKSGYDYLDIGVKYSEEECLPPSFGGVSGGGLWQVPIELKKDKSHKVHDPIYSGVAFYEELIPGKSGLIRCHGRLSVWDKVLNHLKGLQ